MPRPLRFAVCVAQDEMERGKAELDGKVKASGARSLKLTSNSNKEWAEARSGRVKIARGVDYILSGQLRSSLGNQRMSLGLEFYRADGTGADHFTLSCLPCHTHTNGFLPQ